MGTPTSPAPEKERMSTAIYADILGRPHDTRDMAHAASYEFLLAQELRAIYGVPDSPWDSRERVALNWIAENHDSLPTTLQHAAERLKAREIEPAPPADATPKGPSDTSAPATSDIRA